MRIAQWKHNNEVLREDEFYHLVVEDCSIKSGLPGGGDNAEGETISAAALGDAEPDSLVGLSPGLLSAWNSDQMQPPTCPRRYSGDSPRMPDAATKNVTVRTRLVHARPRCYCVSR